MSATKVPDAVISEPGRQQKERTVLQGKDGNSSRSRKGPSGKSGFSGKKSVREARRLRGEKETRVSGLHPGKRELEIWIVGNRRKKVLFELQRVSCHQRKKQRRTAESTPERTTFMYIQPAQRKKIYSRTLDLTGRKRRVVQKKPIFEIVGWQSGRGV